MSKISINCAFDAGNIVVVRAEKPGDIRLNIRKDNASDFCQWFYYRLSGAKDRLCKMTLENAGQTAYPKGWEGYKACASYDRETWFRVPSRYVNGKLMIEHKPELDSVYYAYFAPFSMERHHDMIAQAAQHSDVDVSVIGTTLDGQSLDKIEIGQEDKKARKNIWVIARQHPGESMAEWWMEGFLGRLLDDDDPTARLLRSAARFHIIPNMNPDGSKLGNLRTNRAGANLNREWGKAAIDHCPEVYHTLAAMHKARPSFVLDVHGDEALPYNFIAGAEGIPGWSETMAANQAMFKSEYQIASPDFQTERGYPVSAPGKANMTMCTSFTAQEFNCLSMTLEMPFKDNANLPDEAFGWSPERAKLLGAAVLSPILAVLDYL